MEGLRPSVAIGFAVFLLCLAGWMVCPVHTGNTKEAARKTMCLSNIKQIGAGLALYAEDYDHRLPAATWVDGSHPYVLRKEARAKFEELFTCSIMSRDKKQWGYAMNSAMVGVDLVKIEDPTKRVVLFETDALGKNVVANLAARVIDRHNGGSNVGRADTSARFVKAGVEPE